jgi:hypothetical protein
VNLVVALACEARPLVRYFGLKQEVSRGGMRIYSDGRGLTLLISGVGKTAMAGACGYLAGLQQQSNRQAAWLNIGIAGHGDRTLGDGVRINRVTDLASGRVAYPPLVVPADCPSSALVTVEQPQLSYDDDVAYDMEGSVFVAVANRFVTAELIQLFKIISDNRESPVVEVTEKKIVGWVEGQLGIIDRLIGNLALLSNEYNGLYTLPDEFHQLAALVRLTASQRVQLESSYRRYHALGGVDLLGKLTHAPISDGKELLEKVQGLIPLL